MKSKVIITSIIFLSIFFSCKKDDENTLPVLSVISDQTVATGNTEYVGLSASDLDGDSLTLSITTDQEFLSITNFSQTGNNATATLVIEPEKDHEGSHNVSVQVSDGKGGTDNENFDITVTVPPYNISDIVGKWSGSASNTYTFSLTINIDSEGNASGTGANGDIEFESDTEFGSEPWTIDHEGKVIGYNFTWFFNGNTFNCEDLCGAILLCGAVGKWELQLNNDKSALSGEYACSPLGNENIDVNLTKQSDEPDEPDEPDDPELTVTDYDDNEYNIVTIGDQVWMQENLKAIHYAYGSEIDSVFDHPESTSTYGRLYHWPAAMNHSTTESVQGACPTGWHIPSKAEFEELFDYLGGKEIAGGKLKSTGTTLWWEPNEGATNESGFTALPAGWNGYAVGMGANFWTSTKQSDTHAYRYEMSYNTAEVNFEYGDVAGINEGISVRCIED